MERINDIRQFYLLQVNDALFPVGGYSHSQGLETYIQKGIVRDEKSAARYLLQKLKWNVAYTDLLAVKLAFEAALERKAEELDRLEEVLEASRIPMEQREAVRKMGSRFAKTMMGLSIKESGIFTQYIEQRKGKNISHSCVYGVFCAAVGLEEQQVLAHYLYAQTSAMVTNCVKTIPLSQSTGQKLLTGCYPVFQEILEEISHCTMEDLAISAPGFDIRGIQHEKLYSRLYMS
ncbi:MAG: urease accessory protein UreF [Blautia sp.]|nr:urease accessory protein UreF [Blautia sp.]